MSSAAYLDVRHLAKYYPVRSRFWARRTAWLHAVDDISFVLHPGETVGLVGESGCGKSTTALLLLRLIEPSAGAIVCEGQDVCRLSSRALLPYRRKVQIVFQNPYASLNPKMTIRRILLEPLLTHHVGVNAAERQEIVQRLLERVHLPSRCLEMYPHELSGGQRQRVAIARALAVTPRVVIADEAVSALDVSIRAQIVETLAELQARDGLTYLFISHDLSLVYYLCTRVLVMYLGQIVEEGSVDEVFTRPLHPYTQALLAAIPEPDPERERMRIRLTGDVPSPIDPAVGCRFSSRCSYRMARCREADPELLSPDGGRGGEARGERRVACFLHAS